MYSGRQNRGRTTNRGSRYPPGHHLFSEFGDNLEGKIGLGVMILVVFVLLLAEAER